ncbi:MAG: hemolysin III family protein [Planctomycetota bacterium]|nr:hemolysin III family protein [Planctomycetota bacterium]
MPEQAELPRLWLRVTEYVSHATASPFRFRLDRLYHYPDQKFGSILSADFELALWVLIVDPLPEIYHLPGFYSPFSVISHLLGAIVFAVLGVLLVRRARQSGVEPWSLGVYAGACVLLLAMSSVYHMLDRSSTAGQIMRRLDHSAIFILIAGTFTPVHVILFRGVLRWLPLLLIWTAAIIGITLKCVFFDSLPEWVGLSLYLTMGWLGAITGTLVARRHDFRFVAPLLWGGIAYSVGALMEFNRWPIVIPSVVHAHEMFHLAVLLGLFFQWLFVWQLASGRFIVPVEDALTNETELSTSRRQPGTRPRGSSDRTIDRATSEQ